MEDDIVTQYDSSNVVARRGLAGRRLALLASVVGICAAVLLVGPSAFDPHSATWTSTARAAESAVPAAGFADLATKVKPSVISVRVKLEDATITPGLDHDGNIEPFGFNERSPFDHSLPRGAPQFHENVVAEGSGFFISPDGYAVTNNHVVDNAKSVQVTTNDGRALQAKIVGRDRLTDLAVIKVPGDNFSYVKFAEHPARVGDWVVAVGNPYGLGGTVTAGIISANGRDIGSGPYEDFVQIDAPINKGNSGGPTFDLEGNVIGVNTAIYSPSGGSVGIGFDIPASTAQMVVKQLMEKGHVTHGWMGVQVQQLTPDIANGLGLKKVKGALVDEAQADTPAAYAGIKAGDVITSVNGTEVKESGDLARKIASTAPGTSVKLGVWRNNEENTITLTLGQLPGERQARGFNEGHEQSTGTTPRLGVMLAPAGEINGAGSKGVAVTGVNPEGAAAEHGIQPGDIILEVDGKTVSRPADVRNELADLNKAGRHIALIRVKSGNVTKFVAIPFSNG
jgi:serine protease Do